MYFEADITLVKWYKKKLQKWNVCVRRIPTFLLVECAYGADMVGLRCVENCTIGKVWFASLFCRFTTRLFVKVCVWISFYDASVGGPYFIWKKTEKQEYKLRLIGRVCKCKRGGGEGEWGEDCGGEVWEEKLEAEKEEGEKEEGEKEEERYERRRSCKWRN